MSEHRDFSFSVTNLVKCSVCLHRIIGEHRAVVCALCGRGYHLACHQITSLSLIDPSSWFCTCCLQTLFPFNHISCEDEFVQCLNDIPDVILSLGHLREGPRLEVYTDAQENRPLTLNYDLDPDDNYFINRPLVSKYSTPSALETVFSSNRELTSLMHINSRSLASKISTIAFLLNQLSIDILAITETWLEEPTTDSTQITGYSLIHKVRSSGRGGGVGFAIKNHIKYKVVDRVTPDVTLSTGLE